MRPTLRCLAASLAFTCDPAASASAAGQALALGQADLPASTQNQHPDARWFPAAGLGLFIHWGIAAVQAKGDLSWAMLAHKGWYDATIPPADYYGSIRDWRADRLDFDAMLGAAKAAGFNYAVFVTKHHDGFTLWPTEHGDLGTRQHFAGRDFVGEFVAACRRHGLKVGLYYSPPDWWFDRDYRSWAASGPDLDQHHRPVTLPPKPADHDARRAALVRAHVTELLTRYGTIDLLWFDGGKAEITNDEVRRFQPGIVLNRRNRAPGDYDDSEGAIPDRRFTGWFEACIPAWPMRKWSHTEEYPSFDAAFTLTTLSLLRAWGGNLLANLGPRADGSVPEPALDCWHDMAAWMRHSREAVEGTAPGPWPESVNVPVTRRPGVAYLHFLPALPDDLPRFPPQEKTFTRTRDILKTLPAEPATEAVWRGVPRPARATLLRTREPVAFQHEGDTLRLALPQHLHTPLVDVVKLEWPAPSTSP